MVLLLLVCPINVTNKRKNEMDDNKEYPVGWECPRCGSVNAPQKDKCKCIKTESSEKDTKQLLVE